MKTSLVRAKKYSFVYKNTYPMYLRELVFIIYFLATRANLKYSLWKVFNRNQIGANLELQLSKKFLKQFSRDQHLK